MNSYKYFWWMMITTKIQLQLNPWCGSVLNLLSLERLRDVLASTITIRADYQDWMDELSLEY